MWYMEKWQQQQQITSSKSINIYDSFASGQKENSDKNFSQLIFFSIYI